jgi:thiol:disulfide interchange protein DsbD
MQPMSRAALLTIRAAVATTAVVLAAALPGAALDELLDGADTSTEPALEFHFVASHTTVEPGQTALVAITTDIPQENHLQDQTYLTLDEGSGFTLGRSWHSPLQTRMVGQFEFLEFVGEFLAVYELRADPAAAPGPRSVKLTFEYYPCNEQVCFGRRVVEHQLSLTVGSAVVENAEFAPFREKLPSLVAAEAGDETTGPPSSATPKTGQMYVERYDLVGKPNILFFSPDGMELHRIVGYRGEQDFYEQARKVAAGTMEKPRERSLPLWFGLALVGGLLAAFSPCVYPMVPITMGYLADQAGPKFGRNLAMTSALGVGVLLPFAAIGAFIGSLKDILYGLTSNAIYILVLDVVLVLLTASMLGAFDIQLPAALRNKAASGRGRSVGLIGAFVIGLVVVPLAFACTAPALGLIIPFIVGRSVAVAVPIMLVFGLGLALPFLVVGVFAGALSALPRAGAWMLSVKKVFALLLVGVIFYVSRPLTRSFPNTTGMLAAAAFIGVAVGLGVFRRHLKSGFNRAVGVAALALGLYLAVASVLVAAGQVKAFRVLGLVRYPQLEQAAFEWRHDLDAAFAEAKREHKLVMAYFWGDNCLACTEYAVNVWAKPEAADVLRAFVPVKINVDE